MACFACFDLCHLPSETGPFLQPAKEETSLNYLVFLVSHGFSFSCYLYTVYTYQPYSSIFSNPGHSSYSRNPDSTATVLESISPWQCYRRCFPKLDLQNCHPPHTQPGNPPTSLWSWSHAQHKYLQPGGRRTEKSREKKMERNMADAGIVMDDFLLKYYTLYIYTYIYT